MRSVYNMKVVVERFFLIGLNNDDEVVFVSSPSDTYPANFEIHDLLNNVFGVASVKIDKRYVLEVF